MIKTFENYEQHTTFLGLPSGQLVDAPYNTISVLRKLKLLVYNDTFQHYCFNDNQLEEINLHIICNKLKLKNYYIDKDNSISVNGNVNINGLNLKKIPIKFNKIMGDFSCHTNNLTSLFNGPDYVEGDYVCCMNKLKSLYGAPTTVKGSFDCSYNTELTSLEGGPIDVGENFLCEMTAITDIDYIPVSVKPENTYYSHNVYLNSDEVDNYWLRRLVNKTVKYDEVRNLFSDAMRKRIYDPESRDEE